MNKGKVELINYCKDKENYIFEYSVEQNNGKTSIEQQMQIASTDGFFDPKWIAQINLDDFPPQNTPSDAANKMADWLERLAGAIRIGNYQEVKRSEFKEISE